MDTWDLLDFLCHFYRHRGDKCLQIKIAGVVGDDEFAMEMHCWPVETITERNRSHRVLFVSAVIIADFHMCCHGSGTKVCFWRNKIWERSCF